jgi:hypothetical protein
MGCGNNAAGSASWLRLTEQRGRTGGEGGGGGGRQSPWQGRKRESDGEEGGLLSSSSTAAADRRGRTAMSDEDDQRRFTVGPLLASTQRERASELHRGRDGMFQRRVDGLLAKNCVRGDGMGGDGGGRQGWRLAHWKLRTTIH